MIKKFLLLSFVMLVLLCGFVVAFANENEKCSGEGGSLVDYSHSCGIFVGSTWENYPGLCVLDGVSSYLGGVTCQVDEVAKIGDDYFDGCSAISSRYDTAPYDNGGAECDSDYYTDYDLETGYTDMNIFVTDGICTYNHDFNLFEDDRWSCDTDGEVVLDGGTYYSSCESVMEAFGVNFNDFELTCDADGGFPFAATGICATAGISAGIIDPSLGFSCVSEVWKDDAERFRYDFDNAPNAYACDDVSDGFFDTGVDTITCNGACVSKADYDKYCLIECDSDFDCGDGYICDADWYGDPSNKVCHPEESYSVIGGPYSVSKFTNAAMSAITYTSKINEEYTSYDSNGNALGGVCIDDTPKRAKNSLIDYVDDGSCDYYHFYCAGGPSCGSAETEATCSAIAGCTPMCRQNIWEEVNEKFNDGACDCVQGGADAGETVVCFVDDDNDGAYGGSLSYYCAAKTTVSDKINTDPDANYEDKRTSDQTLLTISGKTVYCTLRSLMPTADCDDSDGNKQKVSDDNPFTLDQTLPTDFCGNCAPGLNLVASGGKCVCASGFSKVDGACVEDTDVITCYPDADSDTHGNSFSSGIETEGTSCPPGSVDNNNDCDDSDGAIFEKASPYGKTLNLGLDTSKCDVCLTAPGTSGAVQLVPNAGDVCVCPSGTYDDGLGNCLDDGTCSNGNPKALYYQDLDGDTYGNDAVTDYLCSDDVKVTSGDFVDRGGDCADDPAGSCVPRSTYTGCNGLDYSSCTTGSNMFECMWLDGSSIVSPDEINPGAAELCNAVDDDCNGFVDDYTTDFSACYQPGPACAGGTFDCSVFDNSYVRCTVSECSYDAVTGECSGISNCANVPSDNLCFQAGCTINNLDCGSYEVASGLTAKTCDNVRGCTWTCDPPVYKEICSNNEDDDGDGLSDCADPDCQVTSSMSLSAAQAASYNCLGSDVTGDVDVGAGNFYCGVGETEATIGLCCESGMKPIQDVYGDWTCTDTTECYVSDGSLSCDFDYASDFTNWIESDDVLGGDWCVDPLGVRACCEVIAYGQYGYYSDTNNVKVY